MTSKGLLTILLVMACVSILMVALCPRPAASFNRSLSGHPGLAGSSFTGATTSGVTGAQQGNTGNLGNSSAQPTGTIRIDKNPRLPNPICYARCTASCPGFRTPRDEQQCHQRCTAQCGG
jgi:hypothetical protein